MTGRRLGRWRQPGEDRERPDSAHGARRRHDRRRRWHHVDRPSQSVHRAGLIALTKVGGASLKGGIAGPFFAKGPVTRIDALPARLVYLLTLVGQIFFSGVWGRRLFDRC